MMPKCLCFVAALLLCCGQAGSRAARAAATTFRCTWEASGREPFEISKDRKMLEVPDLIFYRIKKGELAMEVVQGREENGFEAILTCILHVTGKDTPEGRLPGQAISRGYGPNSRVRAREMMRRGMRQGSGARRKTRFYCGTGRLAAAAS